MLVGAGALGAADEVIAVAETARRRRREGAARQGGGARRPAVRDRLDRPPGDAAELGHDDGLRHAAHGRLELPVLRVPARGGPGARRADRPRRAHDRHALPDGVPAHRRLGGDAARARSRCSSARPTGRGGRRSRRASPRGGSSWRSARWRMPTRSTRSASSSSSRKRLPDGAILTSDSGSAANWYARDVQLRAGMHGARSRATSRRWGRACRTRSRPSSRIPDRPVDRARRRRRVPDERHERDAHDRQVPPALWPDQRLIVLVLHNNDLNQVTWEQRAMEGDPKFDASQDLPDFDYAGVRRVGRPARHPRRRSRPASARRGTRRCAPTGRS